MYIQYELSIGSLYAELMCGPVRASPGGRVEKIVAAGGWRASALKKVEIYDITSNTWETGG